MSTRRKDVWLARAGLPLGLALAALSVTGWTMPAGERAGGVAVGLTVAPTPELAVHPSGRIARTRELRAGQGVDGTFVATNTTGAARRVEVRAALPLRDLDSALRLRTTIGGRTGVDGTLGKAREWTAVGVLEPAERRRVRVSVTVPPEARGYEYRGAEVRLELQSGPAR